MIIQTVDYIVSLLQTINKFNFESDILILLVYFYSCIPLGMLFNSLKNKNIRILYNLIVGLFFTMMITREWFLIIVIWSLLIYGVSKIKNCFYPVFFVSFAILTYCHIYRLMYDYLSWKMDYNVVQMMITARYIYYAVDKQKGNIQQEDSFLMYLSYIFMFPNLTLAPLPYINFVNLIVRKEDFTHFKYTSTFINLGKAILFSIGEVTIGSQINTNVYQSQWWQELNFFQKLIATQGISIILRFQYFVAFKHEQAAMDAYGITYNPETKKCDRFSVADYHYDVEKNIALKTQMWNSNVQGWLKTCFFEQLQPKFGGLTYYITFLISCIWHGFYGTYYLFFIFWALSVQICKYVYKAQQKFYFIPEKIRHFICYVWSCATIDHLANGMKMLDWNKAIAFHNDMHWIMHIQVILIFLFFLISGFGQKSHKKLKKN